MTHEELSCSEGISRSTEHSRLISRTVAWQTGPDTTLEQLYALYPDLEAEIEEEIAAHEWGKDN